jgi:archaellum biogenesis ATPase FlaH
VSDSLIVKVVGHYLELIPVGDEYKAICPFHNEKTPSLSVVPSKEFYYCFGCGSSGDAIDFVRNKEEVGYKEALEIIERITGLTVEDVSKIKESKTTTKGKPTPLMKQFLNEFINSIGYKSNGYRGIRDDINKFFGHLTKLDANGNVLARYYPETTDDRVVGYTCRNHPKDFSYGHVGTVGSTGQMSGQVKFKTGGKYVLLVGGQEDKAAAYQMLMDSMKDQEYNAIPVVSPNKGENCSKQVAENYDWFNMFDNIIIGLDNDKAGREAALKVAEVLPKEKVKIATWSGKDPNWMLENGKQKQFVRDFYNAKDFVNSGIAAATDAVDGIDSFLTAPKIPLPPQMHRIQDAGRGGFRSTGAIVNIIGDTSIGKSFFSDTLFYYWMFNSPIVPTIISLERTKEELAIDIESLHLKKNLMWFKDGSEAVNYRHRDDVKVLLENLHCDEKGKPRYYIIDERDGKCETLKAQMMRASIKHGSKLFILDPLTDFLRSMGTDVQEDFMMWQKQQKKNGFVFINILHTRKPPTDKEGKVRFVTEYDALGTGSFIQSADVNIVLNRDKMSSCAITRNTTIVDIPKWRGGVTGRIDGGLYYDSETRQQYDKLDWLSSRPDLVTSNNPLAQDVQLDTQPDIPMIPVELYDDEVYFNSPD